MPTRYETDVNSPNWGLPVVAPVDTPKASEWITDPNDPNWGMPARGASTPPSLPPLQAAPPTGDAGHQGFGSQALQALNVPGAATAGFVRGLIKGENPLTSAARNITTTGDQDSFSDVLGDVGMQPGLLRSGLGLAGDIVLDPLNLAGGLIAKGVAKAGKLVAPAMKAIKGTELAKDFGKKFIPFSDIPDVMPLKKTGSAADNLSFRDQWRLYESAKRGASEIAADKAKQLTKLDPSVLKPEEGKKLGFQVEAGAPTGNAARDAYLKEFRNTLNSDFWHSVQKGVQDPNKYIQNYITYVLDKSAGAGEDIVGRLVSAKNRFNKTRNIEDWKAALKAGVETNPEKILEVRLGASGRARETADFFKNVAEQFGADAAKAKTLPGWRKVTLPAEDPLKAMIGETHFSPDVAEVLERIYKVPEERGAILKSISEATRLWKGWATRVNPAFHVRNAYSNLYQMYIGGVDAKQLPGLVRDANRVVTGKYRGKIGNLTPQQVMEAAKHFNIWSFEHTGAFNEMDAVVGKANKAWEYAVKENPLSKAGQKVGNFVENNAKIGLFIDQLRKGKSAEEAALHVKNILFDYAELTPLERNIRDYAVPFYTWQRKNIPLQLKALGLAPAKLGRVEKGLNAVENLTQDTGGYVEPGKRPEYMTQTGYVQVPNFIVPPGGDPSARTFVNPSLPFQDLNKLPTLGDFGDRKRLQEQVEAFGVTPLNPLWKGLYEATSGRDSFIHKPDAVGVGDAIAGLNPFPAPFQMGKRALEVMQPLPGESTSPWDALLSQTAISTKSLTPQELQKQYGARKRAEQREKQTVKRESRKPDKTKQRLDLLWERVNANGTD